jgi:NAD(P)-dependent dehydrogenase (short-subunit alcohol dehydrogenase family)
MKKIVIVGGSGSLGSQVASTLSGRGILTGEGLDIFHPTYRVESLSSKDLDVRDFKKCEEYFDQMKPDILINLSGVNYDKMLHKITYSDQYRINHLLDVNLHGTINLLSTCLPGMREKGYGRIILASSVLSTKIVLGTGLYSSCKAFLDRLVKNASAENISKGVTVNSIQMGYFDGGLTYKVPDREIVEREIPLKRWGTIEELCNTIEYIINTEYLTGTNIPLNGGISC